MKRGSLAVLGLCTAIVAVGCAGVNKTGTPANTNPSTREIVQQIGYGLSARFARCANAACPERTVKTLALAERAPDPPVIEPTANPPRAREVQELRKRFVVPFTTGSARLGKPEAQLIDSELVDAARARRIVITGRTDDNGSARRNDILARKRAETVREYLTKRRLNDTVEITLDSKGSCCYATDNRSASGRAANRRVEVEMLFVTP